MSDFRITPVEVLVVLVCLGLISVLVLPAILISREESRSVTCQSHQVQIVLSIRESNDSVSIVDPPQWPQLLASLFSEGSVIEHCPSDNRQPPAVASYAINPQIVDFKENEANRISFLDFNALVVDLSKKERLTHWNQSVAPRHFDLVNVVFYDSHIEMKEAAEISPNDRNRLESLWLPASQPGN